MSLGVSQILDTSFKRLAICVFNRATYSRCKELITEISNHPGYRLDVILASGAIQEEHGNAKGYIQTDIKHAKVIEIPVQIKDSTHAGSARVTADIIQGLAGHFSNNLYAAVIIVGDRFETLGAAIAASYLNIPLIHVQGGEVTGNIDEKVRHAVTKLSDYHFVSTVSAKKYVLEMGEERSRVFQVGCPSLDVMKKNLIKRYKPKKKYVLCQFHPHTTESKEAYAQTKTVMEAVLEFCAKTNQMCYWYWPNPDPGRDEVIKYLQEAHGDFSRYLIKAENQPPLEFLDRLAGATFLIGNSSCGLRECSYLGVPAINVGERQSIRERSWNVMDVGFDKDQIFSAMEKQKDLWRYKRSGLYGDGRAAEFIVRHMDHIDFTIKGHLTYPLLFKFSPTHFGEKRFVIHARKRKHGPDYGQYERVKARREAGKAGL